MPSEFLDLRIEPRVEGYKHSPAEGRINNLQIKNIQQNQRAYQFKKVESVPRLVEM